MTQILSLISLFGLAYVVLFAPYLQAKGVDKIVDSKSLKVFFPIVNTFYVEKQLEMKVAGLVTLFQVLSWILCVVFFSAQFVGMPPVVALIVLILFAIFTVAYMVGSMVLVNKILSLAAINGKVGTIFYTLVYPMGQVYIGSSLYKYVAVSTKVEEEKKGKKKGMKISR